MGKGRIVGINIKIRKHNRQAIEAHELSSFITLIEGRFGGPRGGCSGFRSRKA